MYMYFDEAFSVGECLVFVYLKERNGMKQTEFDIDCLRAMHPRVHCITNYVTARDCANMLLAVGAQPVMADDPAESAEITAASDALVLNLGTLSGKRLEAMLLSGKQANAMGIPVVLDPVGVTASKMRRMAAEQLLSQVRMSIIRGNAAEIRALTGEKSGACGVDALQEESEDIADALVRRLGGMTGAAVLLTGKTDILARDSRRALIFNGHPVMNRITGTGCQLSALIGAFAAALPDDPFAAALTAACMMGWCGEIAARRMTKQDGSASCAGYMIDAAYRMNTVTLREGARYEQR